MKLRRWPPLHEPSKISLPDTQIWRGLAGMLRFGDLQAKGDDMPRYDFDQPRERKNTSSIKYDAAALLGKREGLVPLWVADMDFPTAQPIIDALVARAKNGIFGYEFASPAYFAAVQGWMFGHFGWETDWKWIVRPRAAQALQGRVQKRWTRRGQRVRTCRRTGCL